MRTERDSAVRAQKEAGSALANAAKELERLTCCSNTLRAFAEFCVQQMAASDSKKTKDPRLFALSFLLTNKPAQSLELKNADNELMGVTKDDLSVWRTCFSLWGHHYAEKLLEIYTAPDSKLSDEKRWFLKNFLAMKFNIDADTELADKRFKAELQESTRRVLEEEQRKREARMRSGWQNT